MSFDNVPQLPKWSIYNFIYIVMKYFNIDVLHGWINGKPVLINGYVWCPMCEHYHENNSQCQSN